MTVQLQHSDMTPRSRPALKPRSEGWYLWQEREELDLLVVSLFVCVLARAGVCVARACAQETDRARAREGHPINMSCPLSRLLVVTCKY